jgi:cytochrome c oxidase subunit 1
MATTDLSRPGTLQPPERGPSGLVGWITTVDHKRIGILYVVTALGFFAIGGALAMLMRAELAEPGRQLLDNYTYNQVFTAHGTLMIYLFSVPIFTGLGNYLVPLQIGAADVAFPRLNAVSYWLFLFGGLVVVSGAVTAGGFPGFGWIAYRRCRRASTARAPVGTCGCWALRSPASPASWDRSTCWSRSCSCACPA